MKKIAMILFFIAFSKCNVAFSSNTEISESFSNIIQQGSPWNPIVEIPSSFDNRDDFKRKKYRISQLIDESLSGSEKGGVVTILNLVKLVDSVTSVSKYNGVHFDIELKDLVNTEHVGLWVKTSDGKVVLVVAKASGSNVYYFYVDGSALDAETLEEIDLNETNKDGDEIEESDETNDENEGNGGGSSLSGGAQFVVPQNIPAHLIVYIGSGGSIRRGRVVPGPVRDVPTPKPTPKPADVTEYGYIFY